MDDGSSSPKKRNLGAHACGAWTCSTPDNFRGEKCLNFPCDALNHLDDSMCVDFLCGAAILLIQDDDEFEAHAAFLVESEGLVVSLHHKHNDKLPSTGNERLEFPDGACIHQTM